jgi:large subunit ribosomal protein L30
MSALRLTQVKSANGANAAQRDTLRSLGLRRIGQTVERPDSPQLRGMVHAVQHLIAVEDRLDAVPDGRDSADGATTTTRSATNG